MPAWLSPRPLRWRPLWLAIGWLIVAAVVMLSLWPRLPRVDVDQFDKIGHFTAYFVMMGWFGFLYLRESHKWIALALVALGITLEIAQYFSGYRAFELMDIGVNSVGVIIAYSITRRVAFTRA